MLIECNMAYRKYWKRWAKYKGSTSTYTLFTARLDSDHVYKRRVDDYINSLKSNEQLQRELERCNKYV
jgi:hypothetical protein